MQSKSDREIIHQWLYEKGNGHVGYLQTSEPLPTNMTVTTLARLDEPSLEAIRAMIREELHKALHPEEAREEDV